MNIKNHFKELLDPTIIIVVLVLIALCFIFTMIFGDKVTDFKQKYKRKFLVYNLSLLVSYAIITFLGYNKLLFEEITDEFIFYQISSLIVGSFHTYLYREYFNKFDSKKYGIELFFCLISVIFSLIPFIIFFTFLKGTHFVFLMCAHFIVFFIPTWVNAVFNYAIAIPSKIFMTWELPLSDDAYPSLSEEEFKDLIVIKLLLKRDEDEEYSSFRAKGPIRIDFGRLFFYFIKDYNERKIDSPIDVEDNGESYEWVFFLKGGLLQQTKYVDAKLPLYMNGIEENSVIICQRISKAKNENQMEKNDSNYEFEFNK